MIILCRYSYIGYARLDKERVQCLQLIESCLNSGLWREVSDLAETINTYLDHQGHWIDQLAAIEMNLTAARQQGARRDESMCLNNLGYICGRRDEHEKALMWYEQSLEIDRELGDRKNEGITLNNIAEIYQQQGKHELALNYYEQDLTRCRKWEDRKGEGIVLNNIGRLYYEQGDYETALEYYEQDLEITLQQVDKAGYGVSLNNIAEIYRAWDNYAKALEPVYDLFQAINICYNWVSLNLWRPSCFMNIQVTSLVNNLAESNRVC